MLYLDMDSILKTIGRIVSAKFILFLVVAYFLVRLIDFGFWRAKGQITPEAASTERTPAEMSYEKAHELCKEFGISDLDWEDYEKGLIRSVFCQTWKRN